MIYLLGHKIAAVGFSEALNLVSSSKIGEKLAVAFIIMTQTLTLIRVTHMPPL
jgi:hypothetical protein